MDIFFKVYLIALLNFSNHERIRLRGSETAEPIIRDVGRIIVSGYDTSYSLPLEVAKSALEKYFSSCGEITDVSFDDCSAYVYFVGEGAVDKALQLNDSELDGWKLTVQPFPFPNAKDKIIVSVEGFDTCLSQIDLESALTPLFSPYGMIEILLINEGSALAAIYGKNIADKASELNGFYMGERKLAVRWLSVPRIHSVHSLPFRKGPTIALLDSDSSTSDAKVSSGRTEIGPHFGVLAKALRLSGGGHVHVNLKEIM
ncbi:PREDICTED: uncharacterized protein LOC104709943 [Camelina sativa]|uniref:Uncharacterized protein LOC104709943 n=1 Tax=Camelina sativa TaxID=90675 RepID=A0ABM0TDK0_CAMSA|nr:PREDICTED: uncharacterized protein LOC104709943 [Camelina sativa]